MRSAKSHQNLRTIRESPLQPVGNGLDRSVNLPTCWGRLPHSVREMSRSDRGRPPPSAGGTRKARDVGANHIEIHGRAWKPAPTTGRRVVAPLFLPLTREVAFAAGKRRRERNEKNLSPQSNATHLTALPSRGTRFCLRLGAPNKIDRFAHKCSLFPPPAAVTFVARQRGRKRRAIRESPLRIVGNGLDRSVNTPTNPNLFSRQLG